MPTTPPTTEDDYTECMCVACLLADVHAAHGDAPEAPVGDRHSEDER